MKGLEIAREYYNLYGKQMLESEFSEVLSKLAIGIAGSGSECYGYDDDISKDHDFEPAFCIFLPDEEILDRKTAFRLERAYSHLPKEFMGLERSLTTPVGGSRHGVIRMSDFFLSKVGSADGRLSINQWFSIPEYSLLEATNGEIFEDFYGEFTAIRERLSYFPQDIRLKKLAGHLLIMGQAGQYNYARCILRGDSAAAQLSVFEFVKSAMHSVFLLNSKYMPYYKWCFKALIELKTLSELYDDLEFLISSGNTEKEAEQKAEVIERICAAIINELRTQKLLEIQSGEMELIAYALNNTIKDNNIRNMHILHGI